jgi:PAS domain S-box-containing protein
MTNRQNTIEEIATEQEVKHLQEELNKYKELFYATINSSQDRLHMMEAVRNEQGEIVDFRWILMNDVAKEKFGDLTGELWLEHYPGVIKEGIFDAFKQVTETGNPLKYKRRYNHEGVDVWVQQSVVKLNDGIVSTTKDITENKVAEREIRHQEHFIRCVHESLPDIITVLEYPSGKIIYSNRDIMVTLGFDEKERVHMPLDERMKLIHDDDKERFSAFYEQFNTLTDGKENVVEYRLRCKTGEWLIMSVRGKIFKRDEQGNVIQVLMFGNDVTERRKNEQELLRLKDERAKLVTDKYHSLFNSIDEAFCIIDVLFDENDKPYNYRFLEANPAFEKQTGLADVVGKTIKDFVPEQEQHWFDIYARIIRTGIPERFEREAKSINHVYEVYAFRMNAPEEHHVAILFKNISERKEYEQQQLVMLKLSDALRPLSDPFEIKRAATRVVGEFLQADCAMYNEISEDGQTIHIEDSYVAEGFPKITGNFPVSNLGTGQDVLRSGEVLVIEDQNKTNFKTTIEKEASTSLGIFASATVPLVKKGRWVANFGVLQGNPRKWTQSDIQILKETAERIWAAVERAKAEQKIMISEQRFRTIAEAAPALVWVCSAPDDRNIFFSEKWYEFTGQTHEEAAGYGWAKAIHPEDRLRIEPYWERCQQTGEIYQGEIRYGRNDGEWRWFNFRALPLYGSSGLIESWYGISIEIHDEKMAKEASLKSENALREMNENLEKIVYTRTQQLSRLEIEKEKERLNAILLGQEQERTRIGEGLHNGVAQLLFAASTNLQLVHPVEETEKRAFASALSILSDAIRDTRNISFELMPPVLKEHGLEVAIQTFMKRVSSQHVYISLSVRLVQRLSERLEISLYRIVQEILNNIMKHSGASKAAIEIEVIKKKYIQLKAEDNGVGFKIKAIKNLRKGIGLQSIENRVKLLDGKMKIYSQPGSGTMIRIRLPV